MKLLRSSLLTFALALAGGTCLPAQPAAPATAGVPAPAAPRVRTSPHETINSKFDGNRVIVVYGRPYSKDPKSGQLRQIWGTLVPYGKVWRTGADEATLFLTQQPIELGGTLVPAGAYTLYTLPAADGSARLIVSKQVGQWGSDPYDEKADFARIDLKAEHLDTQLDQFTMALEKNPDGGGLLKLAWEKTQFSVPFTLKK